MADQELPNSDPDLQLAHAIGQARSEGTPLSTIDDPLIEQLGAYRRSFHQQYRSHQSHKEEVWNAVEAATQPSNTTSKKRLLFTSTTMRWAAAAILLIGALFSFVYLQYWDNPELLAASGSTIQTVQLDDGSTVTLRPHSKLFSIEQSASSLLYKLKGEGWFEVQPQKRRPFSVQTANGRISVLGTRFMLSTWANRTQVFLEEGSVKVQTLSDDQSAILTPGESASIQKDAKITLDTKPTADEFTDWLDEKLIFEQKPVQLIADELEQQFNITLILPDHIADSKLTGQLPLDNMQKSLDDLGLVLGGRFQKKGAQRYEFVTQ